MRFNFAHPRLVEKLLNQVGYSYCDTIQQCQVISNATQLILGLYVTIQLQNFFFFYFHDQYACNSAPVDNESQDLLV